MRISDLVFTGFNRHVAALHRLTGEIMWQWKSPKGTAYVTLLLDGDILVVSVDGYMYGLDPATGAEIWDNPMSGFGTGVTALVSVNGNASGSLLLGAAEASARQVASQTQASA